MSPRQTRGIEHSVFVVLLLTLFLMTVPRESQWPTRDSPRCEGNLKALGFALHSYHDKFGCFPPAFTTGVEGQPMQSWRALLWPHLEQELQFYKYAFSEPWDSIQNSNYHKDARGWFVPDGFHCRHDESDRLHTTYLAVIGPNTAWPGMTCTNQKRDFPDGLDQTILLVEAVNSGIHWLEPRDLQFDGMSFVVNDTGKPAMGSNHLLPAKWPWSDVRRVVNVLFADGSVRSLEADITPETLRALLTRNGGETIEWNSARTRPQVVR